MTHLATFLDNEPFIRFWRPTYHVLGPLIRRVKALFAFRGQYEVRLATLEAAQRETSAAMEQVLLAVLAERRNPNTLEEFRTILADALAAQTAANAAQWSAIEQRVIAAIGKSVPPQFVANAVDSSSQTRGAVLDR